jgi:hypothetical protein
MKRSGDEVGADERESGVAQAGLERHGSTRTLRMVEIKS